MNPLPGSAALHRNLHLYPWYAVCFNALFWYPVFFLYFQDRLNVSQALLLEAVYYAAVPILEVPSGYFSDRVGRRPTLFISALSLFIAYLLFFFGSTFAVFALAQVFLASGMAFNSGTDASFHYDSVAALGREEEYGDREASVAHKSFLATAVGALLGGAVALIDLRWAYGLSALAAGTAIGIVLRMVEPIVADSEEEASSPAPGFLTQLGSCLRLLRKPSLFWLFGFAVLMTVLNHTPYEFYQPYIELIAQGPGTSGIGNWLGGSTPLISGIHTALTMVIASWFAARSIRLRNRLGVATTLLLSTALQFLIIGFMGVFLHLAIVPLILLRSVPRALMAAPLNAAIAPQVPKRQRATYLSLQSLSGRLAFAGVLILLSSFTGQAAEGWAKISHSLHICAGIAVVGLVLLFLTKGQVKSEGQS